MLVWPVYELYILLVFTFHHKISKKFIKLTLEKSDISSPYIDKNILKIPSLSVTYQIKYFDLFAQRFIQCFHKRWFPVNFVQLHSQMLHTKFQNHRPSAGSEEDFCYLYHGGHLGHVTLTIKTNFHSSS